MVKRLRKFIGLMEQKKARLFILLAIIVFNIALWVITSTLAYFIDPTQYGNFFNALLTSGMSLIIDPGSYETSSGTALTIRIISLVTIIISMISFSGGNIDEGGLLIINRDDIIVVVAD